MAVLFLDMQEDKNYISQGKFVMAQGYIKGLPI